ncbi:hypothetical protein KY290_028512 [Solanum tuberosum]|uniref:Uncharacterized protein n=1 Tax=Solanum tuberosum TaxID=4113 RepID=A0ABQ7UI42_SOLTU|nr:hypothetical protein KY290_028512 [Solanum tuberosum]
METNSDVLPEKKERDGKPELVRALELLELLVGLLVGACCGVVRRKKWGIEMGFCSPE